MDLYIADQFAGRLTSLGTQFSVRALSNGWYSLEAVMIDNSGVAVRGKDAIIYIEVDVIGKYTFFCRRSQKNNIGKSCIPIFGKYLQIA